MKKNWFPVKLSAHSRKKNFSLIYFQTKWWLKKEIESEWGWRWGCGYGYGWCVHFRTTTSVSPSYCYPQAFNLNPSISGITNGIVHVKDPSISNSRDWVPSLTGTQSRLAPNRTGNQSQLDAQSDWYPVNWNWCIPRPGRFLRLDEFRGKMLPLRRHLVRWTTKNVPNLRFALTWMDITF